MVAFHGSVALVLSVLSLAQSSSAAVCNADNCLRALRRYSALAAPVCSEYFEEPVTAIPSYAAACSGTVRFESACSCLVYSTRNTASTSSAPPSTSTLISTLTLTSSIVIPSSTAPLVTSVPVTSFPTAPLSTGTAPSSSGALPTVSPPYGNSTAPAGTGVASTGFATSVAATGTAPGSINFSAILATPQLLRL
ncbi:hypothetical protein K402DRAFT_422657 [Aulographum hederae CBS 113979]|uniref:Extracellular membrane protein CFEM domain-containing protein n=1 Tax=Aulographum hederae CBS 113979 TaxID=1176131 RepID=A0A6G1GVF0_9PEZI|nr:hypothetical protein K402DRAFT_422657 [Aulographum hederae CBS 113979]